MLTFYCFKLYFQIIVSVFLSILLLSPLPFLTKCEYVEYAPDSNNIYNNINIITIIIILLIIYVYMVFTTDWRILWSSYRKLGPGWDLNPRPLNLVLSIKLFMWVCVCVYVSLYLYGYIFFSFNLSKILHQKSSRGCCS